MYSKRFVACVKVDGKILREDDNTVALPFGSEYSILLRNLDTVRVQAKVYVDGTDATEGTWLVIQPNSTLELERYIKNGNLQRGNRFKFIERTERIENTRGIQINDGLIRIEWKREKKAPVIEDVHITRHHYYDHYWPRPLPPPRPWWYDYTYCNGISDPSIGSFNSLGSNLTVNSSMVNSSLGDAGQLHNAPMVGSALHLYLNTTLTSSGGKSRGSSIRSVKSKSLDPGITVPGSESNQQFHTAFWFATEDNSEVLVLQLRGVHGGKAVKKAVTVKHKPKCSTCSKTNKPGAKFCVECGTSLDII